MQIFDITIPANSSRPLEAHGTYFYYYSGSAGGADPTITLKEDTGGSSIVLKPGQAFRLPDSSRPAVRWYVANYANAGTIVGLVVIGSGRIDDNRVTGSVEVIDNNKSRTIAGAAFVGSPGVTALAANFSVAQLWNPSATKNLIVKQIQASSGTATGYTIFGNNVALTTDVTATRMGSKKIGSANGVAQVRTQQFPAAPGNPYGLLLSSLTQALTVNVWTPTQEPIVIPPLTGLCVANGTQSADLVASFEWIEEDF